MSALEGSSTISQTRFVRSYTSPSWSQDRLESARGLWSCISTPSIQVCLPIVYLTPLVRDAAMRWMALTIASWAELNSTGCTNVVSSSSTSKETMNLSTAWENGKSRSSWTSEKYHFWKWTSRAPRSSWLSTLKPTQCSSFRRVWKLYKDAWLLVIVKMPVLFRSESKILEKKWTRF